MHPAIFAPCCPLDACSWYRPRQVGRGVSPRVTKPFVTQSICTESYVISPHVSHVPQSICYPEMHNSPVAPQTYITQSLCSPVPMFLILSSPYVFHSRCSPVPKFPSPYAPQSLCSPVPMLPREEHRDWGMSLENIRERKIIYGEYRDWGIKGVENIGTGQQKKWGISELGNKGSGNLGTGKHRDWWSNGLWKIGTWEHQYAPVHRT